MYLQHELREVTDYRQTEALERIHFLHSLMSVNPGFIGALSCRYLGRVDQYAWLRFWSSSAEQTAFRQTQPARDFGQTRPEGLYGPLPGGIGAGLNWESRLEHSRDGGGGFLVRSVFGVSAGRETEFLERRGAYDKLALENGGIHSLLTFGCVDAGSENIFLTLTRAAEREAYNTLLESPAATAFRQTLPSGLCETLTTECYLIVNEVMRT